MTRRRFLVLALCLPLLAAAACRRTGNDVTRGNRDCILPLDDGADPTDLNPHVITGTKEFVRRRPTFPEVAPLQG